MDFGFAVSVAVSDERGVEQSLGSQVPVGIQLGQGLFIEVLLLRGAPEKGLRGIGRRKRDRKREHKQKSSFHNAASIRLSSGGGASRPINYKGIDIRAYQRYTL